MISRKAFRSVLVAKERIHAPFSSSLKVVSSPKVELYQYAICPFCNKVKALLSYAGFKPTASREKDSPSSADMESVYTAIEVNPLTKVELKPWSGDYRKVPIAKIDGEAIKGSEEICDALLSHPHVLAALESRWRSEALTFNTENDKAAPMSMEVFKSSDSARKWSEFAHEELASLLYPNICRSLGDSYRAFGYVNDVRDFSPLQKVSIRAIGSLAMYFAASKIKSKFIEFFTDFVYSIVKRLFYATSFYVNGKFYRNH